MQVGLITVAGSQIGTITFDTGGTAAADVSPIVPAMFTDGDSPRDAPDNDRPIGDGARGGSEVHERSHSDRSRSDPNGGRQPNSRSSRGETSGEIGAIPYSSSGNPFDRSRFAKELEQKPWLKEKMAHLSLGENQDPRANLAVIETMMNRAIVRDTSLEQQVKRHRSSGVDEGGYYAGWAPHYSSDKRQMFERNLGEALGQSGKGQSNVSNYATDNSSGGLATRERASGAFKHHTTINGESFFSPGRAEPAFRDRWQQLNRRASDYERSKTTDTAAPAKSFDPEAKVGPQSSIAARYKVASAIQDPVYTSDDINELISERPTAGMTGSSDTRKPDINELDKTYDSPQQERFNRPYAYGPQKDPSEQPPTGAEKKEPLPSHFYPPTPGDENDPDKKGTKPGWNIPSDYDLG